MAKLARLFVSLSLPLFAFAGCSGDDDTTSPAAGKGGKGGSGGSSATAGASDGGASAGESPTGAAGVGANPGASGQTGSGGSGARGGSTSVGASGTAGEEAGGGSSVGSITLPAANAEYATVAELDLSVVGLPVDVVSSDIAVSKGALDGLTLADQQIRFITPSDPGTDTLVELTVSRGSKTYVLPVRIQSARPSAIVAYVEGSEDTGTGSVPTLEVTGLGTTNALEGDALSFSVADAPPLDAGASSGTIYVPTTNDVIDLGAYWTYDATANSLDIDTTKMASLLGLLPPADVQVSISLTSENGNFAYAWNFSAHKPIATLTGTVVDVQNMPSSALNGRLMGIRGIDNRTRRVVKVAKDGTFTVDELVEGTYDVTLLDPEQPGFWKSTVPIFQTDTAVTLKFPYAAAASPKLVGKSAGKLGLSGRTLHAPTSHDGALPPQRSAPAAKATPTDCETVGTDGTFTYVAMAAAQNTTITCVAEPEIPAGTKKLGVRIDVFSQEYPDFTTEKSQFNDTWSYAVAGIPGLGGASGAVNDTHYTQATITKEVCIDIASQAKSNAFTFAANLAATNVGDSALPTSVTMTVTPDCTDKLTVTGAVFSTPNNQGYTVVKPTGSGNIDFNYISLPIQTAETAWGVPLTVHYQPASAEISAAKIGVVVNGEPTFASDDILAQATTTSPGVLTFKDLVLPTFDLSTFSGKTSIVVQLTGTVDGNEQQSDPNTGLVSFASQQTFVPLFLADDSFESSRRYGARDTGGDSWVTYDTLNWLLTREYRFDDTSALQVAQTSSGRSVMDHAGHSDGTQIDMRYADGMGGYTDQLGGASDGSYIKQMLTKAASEVATNAADKPNLSAAVAWITDNRLMMQNEASYARNIYAGPGWMKLALYDGKFPKGDAIPGVTVWTSKPGIVSFVAPHLHHWHVSLKGASVTGGT